MLFKFYMNLALFLFLIGILGFILNRKNIILMIISIEIMLLAVTILILISSFTFDDNIGQTFSIFIISIAGAESVIGLSILVAYYRLTFYWISLCLSLFINFKFKSINKYPYLFCNSKTKYNSIKKISYLNSQFRNIKGPSVASLARQEKNYSTGPACIVKYNDSNNDAIKFIINPWFVTGLYDAEKKSLVV